MSNRNRIECTQTKSNNQTSRERAERIMALLMNLQIFKLYRSQIDEQEKTMVGALFAHLLHAFFSTATGYAIFNEQFHEAFRRNKIVWLILLHCCCCCFSSIDCVPRSFMIECIQSQFLPYLLCSFTVSMHSTSILFYFPVCCIQFCLDCHRYCR